MVSFVSSTDIEGIPWFLAGLSFPPHRPLHRAALRHHGRWLSPRWMIQERARESESQIEVTSIASVMPCSLEASQYAQWVNMPSLPTLWEERLHKDTNAKTWDSLDVHVAVWTKPGIWSISPSRKSLSEKNNCNGPKHTKDDKIDNFTIIPKTANLSLLEDARVPTHYSENW